MRAKSPVRLRAAELCQQFPDTPNRTLAKRLASECKAITVEQARNHIREVRGVHGKKSAKTAEAPKAPGKAGTKPQLPPSLAEPWLPFELSAGVIGAISDIHIPYHSTLAIGSAVKKLKKRKIDTLLLNGDIGDYYSISRHQKNPKLRDFKKELQLQLQFLQWIRSEFPKCRIIYKAGNHEDRWDHWLWNCAPEISDHPRMRLSEWLEFDNLGIEWVADERPIMAGKLPIFHGHELGKTIFSPVNPARGAFLRTHHTVLVSHSHQTSGHADTNLWHDETFVWSIACLCDMTPKYARINRWNWGFAEIEVYNDKSFDVSNLRIGKDGVVRSS